MFVCFTDIMANYKDWLFLWQKWVLVTKIGFLSHSNVWEFQFGYSDVLCDTQQIFFFNWWFHFCTYSSETLSTYRYILEDINKQESSHSLITHLKRMWLITHTMITWKIIIIIFIIIFLIISNSTTGIMAVWVSIKTSSFNFFEVTSEQCIP